MAANEALNALSTTDASNTPAGGDTIGATLDDELRSIKANIARGARWEVTATVTAAATLTETVLHKVVPVDGSAGGTTTITLPTAGSAGTGFATMMLKVGAANNAIVDGSGAETIDGAANYTLTEQYESVVLVCDGAQWFATSRGNRKTMPALSVDGDSTLSGAVTMKTSLTNTGPTTLDGSLTMSATALFALPVTLAGAVTVTGDADFQGALNCGTLTASATAVFKANVIAEADVTIAGDLGVSGTASVGALVVGGVAYAAGGYEYVSTNTPSGNPATLQFTDLASGYDHIFVLDAIAPVTDNVDLRLQTSPDTGGSPTLDSGAGNYSYIYTRDNSAAPGSPDGEGSTGDTFIEMAIGQGNAANETINGEVTVINPGASTFTHVNFHVIGWDTATQLRYGIGSGARKSAAAVNAVGFLWSSGNFADTGSIRHYRRKTS